LASRGEAPRLGPSGPRIPSQRVPYLSPEIRPRLSHLGRLFFKAVIRSGNEISADLSPMMWVGTRGGTEAEDSERRRVEPVWLEPEMTRTPMPPGCIPRVPSRGGRMVVSLDVLSHAMRLALREPSQGVRLARGTAVDSVGRRPPAPSPGLSVREMLLASAGGDSRPRGPFEPPLETFIARLSRDDPKKQRSVCF
jgi:hypothetical protein